MLSWSMVLLYLEKWIIAKYMSLDLSRPGVETHEVMLSSKSFIRSRATSFNMVTNCEKNIKLKWLSPITLIHWRQKAHFGRNSGEVTAVKSESGWMETKNYEIPELFIWDAFVNVIRKLNGFDEIYLCLAEIGRCTALSHHSLPRWLDWQPS